MYARGGCFYTNVRLGKDVVVGMRTPVVSTQTRGHRGKCTNSRFIRQWQGVKSKAESLGG